VLDRQALSPLPSRVALDNTVISSLFVAGALSQILELWEGNWIVPLQVRDEAAAWKARGAGLVILLNNLQSRGVVEYASPEPGPEGALFAQLQRTRGQGESAVIAIAYSRRLVVATDDRQARRSCETLTPAVPTFATEDLLSLAVADGLLTLPEAQAIWSATGILDPNRGIKI
jgi:predicted nucleic acid-binding protein